MRSACFSRFFQAALILSLANAQPIASPVSLRRDGPPAVQRGGPTSAATSGLACIQNALGGVTAFAGVSSFRIKGITKVTKTTGMRPVPSNREIGVQFPDRFKYLNVQTDPPHGSPPLISLTGFNGDVYLSNMPKPPDQALQRLEAAARASFVRQIMMRLPRELPNVRISEQRISQEGGQGRLAVDLSGLPGLEGTLLADSRSCMPVAIQFISGSITDRIALSDYRRFGGILFPTVLKTTRNGDPLEEEYDSEVQVNPRFDADYFRNSGR